MEKWQLWSSHMLSGENAEVDKIQPHTLRGLGHWYVARVHTVTTFLGRSQVLLSNELCSPQLPSMSLCCCCPSYESETQIKRGLQWPSVQWIQTVLWGHRRFPGALTGAAGGEETRESEIKQKGLNHIPFYFNQDSSVFTAGQGGIRWACGMWTCAGKEPRGLFLILRKRTQSGVPGSQRVGRWQCVWKQASFTTCPRRNRSEQLYPGHQELRQLLG